MSREFARFTAVLLASYRPSQDVMCRCVGKDGVCTYVRTCLQNDKLSIFIAEDHMLEGSVVTLACHSDCAGLWRADPLQGLSWGAGVYGEADCVWGHLGGRREEGWSEGEGMRGRGTGEDGRGGEQWEGGEGREWEE